MDWAILGAALSAVAAAWSSTMKAYYHYKSVKAIVGAWHPKCGYSLPATIRALQPRRHMMGPSDSSHTRPIEPPNT
jgi:hypothetical protein